jgi:uncharacterized RDD family membrane protein YckC
MPANPYAPPGADLGERVAANEQLAERGTRLGAALLDGLVGGLVPTIAFALSMPRDPHGRPGSLGVAIAVLWWVAVLGYQAYLLTTRGQTLGKRWLGIKLARVDGQPIGFGSAVMMRALVGQGILGMIPIYGLVDLLFIFRDDRRCVHDLVAGTKVVVA